MARRRGESNLAAARATGCDYCIGRKGHNQQVVHILSRPDRDALIDHLAGAGLTDYTRDWFLTLWDSAHRLYGDVARSRFQPIALVYLEENGVKVPNRGEWVMRWRKHRAPERVLL